MEGCDSLFVEMSGNKDVMMHANASSFEENIWKNGTHNTIHTDDDDRKKHELGQYLKPYLCGICLFWSVSVGGFVV